jgi:iron(III) transport system ATP-binding protein
MMFQSYALWPHLSVFGNVAFGLEERRLPKAEVKARTEEALAAVQMAGLGERRIHQLSGGQQQRVALARAMVVRPRCLLLDEPLSNLDAKLRLEMRGEIRRICREFGLTAIYVTHDQGEALSIADRMAVLRQGRIEQIGTPRDIYRGPRSRFVADFMGETNFLEGRVVARANGEAQVETAVGTLTARAEEGAWPVGEKATLSIRPESWRMGSDGGIACRVASRVYLGQTAQITVTPQAATGQTLRVLELNPRFAGAENGGIVSLSVAPEEVVLLPAD